MSSAVASKALGSIISLGAASAVAGYVYQQLHAESAALDRAFSPYNTPESEASRQRVFDGAMEDPRKSSFNVLGWKR